MQRRELLKMIAVVTGAAVVGGELFLSGCKTPDKTGLKFSTTELSLLNEIGDTILPPTDSPGAKEADVASFMELIVRDCYPTASKEAFVEGIKTFEKACKEANNGKSYMDCTPEERSAFLLKLEEEAKAFNADQDKKDAPRRDELKKQDKEYDFVASPRHYYTMMKQLTILGYFTSEIGQKKALRHNPVPGSYDGAYPYKKGDKAWA